MVGLSPALATVCCAIGSACLGFWLVVSKSSLGPRRVPPAFLLCAVAYGLLRLAGPLASRAVNLGGPSAALLLVAVPIFSFYAFLEGAGLLLRVFAGSEHPALTHVLDATQGDWTRGGAFHRQPIDGERLRRRNVLGQPPIFGDTRTGEDESCARRLLR